MSFNLRMRKPFFFVDPADFRISQSTERVWRVGGSGMLGGVFSYPLLGGRQLPRGPVVAHVAVLPWDVGQGEATLRHVDHNVVRSIMSFLSVEDLFSCLETCRFLFADARHVLCARAKELYPGCKGDVKVIVAHELFGHTKNVHYPRVRTLFRLRETTEDEDEEWNLRSGETGTDGARAIGQCIAQHGSVSAMLASKPEMTDAERQAFMDMLRTDLKFPTEVQNVTKTLLKQGASQFQNVVTLLRRVYSVHTKMREHLKGLSTARFAVNKCLNTWFVNAVMGRISMSEAIAAVRIVAVERQTRLNHFAALPPAFSDQFPLTLKDYVAGRQEWSAPVRTERWVGDEFVVVTMSMEECLTEYNACKKRFGEWLEAFYFDRIWIEHREAEKAYLRDSSWSVVSRLVDENVADFHGAFLNGKISLDRLREVLMLHSAVSEDELNNLADCVVNQRAKSVTEVAIANDSDFNLKRNSF